MKRLFVSLVLLALGCGGPPLDAAFSGTWIGTQTIDVDEVGTYGPTPAQVTVTVSGTEAKVAALCPGGVITATGSGTSATWAISYTEVIGPSYDPAYPDIRPIIQQPSISCPPTDFVGVDGGMVCREAILQPEHATVSLTRLASHDEFTVVATGFVRWCYLYGFEGLKVGAAAPHLDVPPNLTVEHAIRLEFVGTKADAGGAGARHPEQDASH